MEQKKSSGIGLILKWLLIFVAVGFGCWFLGIAVKFFAKVFVQVKAWVKDLIDLFNPLPGLRSANQGLAAVVPQVPLPWDVSASIYNSDIAKNKFLKLSSTINSALNDYLNSSYYVTNSPSGAVLVGQLIGADAQVLEIRDLISGSGVANFAVNFKKAMEVFLNFKTKLAVSAFVFEFEQQMSVKFSDYIKGLLNSMIDDQAATQKDYGLAWMNYMQALFDFLNKLPKQ